MGNIPGSIGSLANLRTLNVSANNFSGEIPGTLGQLKELTHFSSNQNQLSGSIPDQLANLTGLQFLDLSYNRLQGRIPPEIFSLSNLQTLDLTQNLLNGQIPQNFSTMLFRLRIGNNSLNGGISSTIGNATGLTYLEMNNNFLHGQIPQQLASCTSLQLLDLSHNKLTGSLTDQLASLKHLQVLKLPSNHFHGTILDNLSNLSNLSYIDLSGNLLSGSIPPKIFKLRKLQNLRLQNNNLTGAIPKNVQDGVFLLELQLGGNNLNGTIPQEIGSITKLQIQLNLSCNSLEGEIPSSLSGLSTLEILDLSNNKLSGEVPDSLIGMSSLTLLNVSNNRLTGVLPKFPNSTKGLIIIDTGNPGLCTTGQCGSAPPASTRKRISAILIIGVAVAGAVFAIGAVALFIVASKYFRRDDHQMPEVQLARKIEGHFIHPDSIHRLRIDFEKGVEATLDPANVFLKNKFSTYYKAVMPSGISYSVKKLNWTDRSFKSGSYRKLGAELEKQGKLRHPNILTPLAQVLDTDCAYLFYEYVHKGSLSEFLHTSNVSVLDWPSRCSIAIGVAQGLAFLHGCQQPIFHLDLTAKNILLKSLTEPQIGDIELCKIVDPSKSTGSISAIAGSVGYVPPEYAYTMRVTSAGNVYSFGVILLELLTGRTPITSGMDLAKWVQSTLSGEETWEQILDTRIRNFSLQIQNEMVSMLKIALSCVSSSPDSRPKMRTVVGMLQLVRQVAE
jgi:Leucine-rich repeat (LRR) protein